jgi:preprotein translocase subunit SecB
VDETKPPGIKLSQIYLANAHFGHIENAISLSPTTPVPGISTQINVQIGMSEDEQKGFCSMTVGSDPEDKTLLYQFHIEMVLVAEADPEPNLPLKEYLMRAGPPTLYPFIRETLASLSLKGRFGALWLPPTNFTGTAEKMLADITPEPINDETNKPRA